MRRRIYQNGAITFARGYGFANLTHDVPITPTTRFTTGSVSKQFTAASIAPARARGSSRSMTMCASTSPR
ncbi:MAG: serine hydrolase [Gemmatimonadetes bacterium]|nr:serine hydrolase [Gemmatimonadota bacterium]